MSKSLKSLVILNALFAIVNFALGQYGLAALNTIPVVVSFWLPKIDPEGRV